MILINHLQKYSLFSFLFFINFQEWDVLNIGFFSVSKLIGLIYFMTILPQFTFFTNNDRNKKYLLSIWILFGLLTLVNVLNINSASSNIIDFSLFQNIFLFLFLINHARKDPMLLEKGMLSIAMGSVSLALLFNAGIGIEYLLGRVIMFGENSNIVGLRMCISIVILISVVIQNRLNLGRLRYLFLLPIPLMLLLMAETGSRTAIITFGIIFILGIFLLKTKKYWTKLFVLAIGAAALFYSILLIMQSELLIQRLLLSYTEGDLSSRDVIWEMVLPIIMRNPIVGVGQTGYFYYMGDMSPHNVFLEVLCYSGIVGLFLYLNFLVHVFIASYKTYKLSGYILPMILMIPITAWLISGQLLTQKLGWIIFAFIVSSSTLISKETVKV